MVSRDKNEAIFRIVIINLVCITCEYAIAFGFDELVLVRVIDVSTLSMKFNQNRSCLPTEHFLIIHTISTSRIHDSKILSMSQLKLFFIIIRKHGSMVYWIGEINGLSVCVLTNCLSVSIYRRYLTIFCCNIHRTLAETNRRYATVHMMHVFMVMKQIYLRTKLKFSKYHFVEQTITNLI